MQARKYGVEIEFIMITAEQALEAVSDAGIDVQIEGYNHTTSPHWKIVIDASCGLEIVSPILQGEDGLEQINMVCSALQRAGAKIDKRCGLHVHMDVSDFSLPHFKNLFKYWVKFEDVFEGHQQVPLTLPCYIQIHLDYMVN